MSYQKKIDDMVGAHVAEYQLKFTVAKELEGCPYRPAMPYGYPLTVYRPMHTCMIPKSMPFHAHTGGTLANGVPKVLTMDIVSEYPLGVWFPHTQDPPQ